MGEPGGKNGSRTTIRLLGGFAVETADAKITAADFERPLAAQLIKLLALADARTLHREQVIDALWPDRSVEQAAPQLHKMASYARKALGDKTSVTFRDESVILWPTADISVDVVEFETAITRGDADAADLYTGDLLPEDLYEDWVGPTRDRLRELLLKTLRESGQWDRVLAIEPADEAAHVANMRQLVEQGQRLAALRQFERLEAALHEELGVSPSREALDLRAEIIGDQADRPELIGREEERFALRHHLDQANAEAGSLVVLSGPPGIGKTALAAWIVERAAETGFSVGRSVAAGIDDPRPYAPVLEAIDVVLRSKPSLLDQLPDTHRDELVRVRDAAETPHYQPEPGDGHERLYVAVDALIGAAAESGLVLMIDDAHLADQASLDLLQYLSRRARRRRLLIVATARSSTEGRGIDAVRSVIAATAAHEIQVGPLNDHDARSLVSSLHANTDAADAVVALGGGTPFYLEALARASAGGVHLPSRVADLARVSLSGVDPDVRDALQRIAVVGMQFDTDQFLALSGSDEDTAFDLLDRALSSDTIAHTSAGYRFSHGLIRESLVADLAPHHKRRIHRDAAVQFESTGTAPARVAHHLIEAGDHAKAAPWALTAAQAAIAVGALADARSTIAPVVDHAEGEVRFALLMARADAMAGMSDPGALAAYQEVLAEAPPMMVDAVKAKMGRTCLMQADVESAKVILEGIEPNGGPFDGPILQVQGMLAYITRDLDTAANLAAEAREIALASETSSRLLDVLTLQGMVAHDRGEWFDRIGQELTVTADSNELAATVFDCHL